MQRSAIEEYVNALCERLLRRGPSDGAPRGVWLGVHAPTVSTLLRERGR